jgi:hypothetical protein
VIRVTLRPFYRGGKREGAGDFNVVEKRNAFAPATIMK